MLEREGVGALRRQTYEYAAMVERERKNKQHPPAATIYNGLPSVNFLISNDVSAAPITVFN